MQGRDADDTNLFPTWRAFAQSSICGHQQYPRAIRCWHGVSLPCEGDAISSTYKGGRIRLGMQVGRVTGVDTIELLFHCLTLDGELLSGWSRGTVGVDQTGRTILSFVWGWLSGAVGGGESSYVEVVENKRHA